MTGRPRGAKEFQRLLQRHAAQIDQLPQRVMHLVRVGVVCAMLDEVRHPDGGHLFIVKGGTAMQLRLGVRARATIDLDMVFAGRVEDWLARFDAVTMERSWSGFTIARKAPPVQIEVNSAGYRPWRVPLRLRYEGRAFGSVSVEVAIDEAAGGHQDLIEADGIALAAFEFDPPRLVPCLDVPHQIAQKLHACTEPLPDGNDRVRDIIDIWLLEALVEPGTLSAVREACLDTFRRRRQHDWPPAVNSSSSWPQDYALLVAEHPDAPSTLDGAVEYVAQLIKRIDSAS